tara:strand:- start:279 stop:458 length:180 start_codon:yes stop_codon:yes gene_type:complete
VGIDAGEDWIGVERDTSGDFSDHKLLIHKCFGLTNLRVQIFCLKLAFGHKKTCRKRQAG